MWTWWTASAATAYRTTDMWDRLWVGILDLFGVWWLVRRKKRVPDATEIG